MNRLIVVLGYALLLFVSTGCKGQDVKESGSGSSVTEESADQGTLVKADISTDELQKMITDNPDLQILDVRTPGEVAEGIIEGAKVVDINDGDFVAKVKEVVDPGKPVAVYCRSGGRSARASGMLRDNGFTQVSNVLGGMTKWSSEGKPVVKQ